MKSGNMLGVLGLRFDALASSIDESSDLGGNGFDDLIAVVNLIESTPAFTIEELCIKARVVCWALLGDLVGNDEMTADISLSIVRDLIRISNPELERPGGLGICFCSIKRKQMTETSVMEQLTFCSSRYNRTGIRQVSRIASTMIDAYQARVVGPMGSVVDVRSFCSRTEEDTNSRPREFVPAMMLHCGDDQLIERRPSKLKCPQDRRIGHIVAVGVNSDGVARVITRSRHARSNDVAARPCTIKAVP